ncbi:MAG TPA: lipoyl(octanoyl) transferase LipB [Polyangia bacterium]|jgi:lipoate-protein ligase B
MPALAPSAAPAAPPLVVLARGLVPYEEALALMRDLVAQRARDACPDTLVLLEHPHVFTVGRRAEAARNVLAPGDVPVVAVERGGDVTYHGPGQLVGYPILKLAEGERDLARVLRGLEEALIRALAEVPGLAAERRPGFTGVWHGGRKLGSIGVAVRDWVTYHGFALNVTTDLSYFRRINPCGLSPEVMGTVAEAVGGPVDAAALRGAVARAVAAVFGRRLAA